MIQPLTIKNARVWDGEQAKVRDLYTSDVVLEKPALGALTVDLEGYTIFPGLINAHDHLELNHYPRSKFREVYNNAHEWGEDMNARLNEPPYKELRAYPLADRLFIGGLKNLLCGATTVAHHNPPHKELFRKDFPVRVLKNYGWAHSLHFNTEAEVVESYRKTPKDWPWFIHLAEGTDNVAASEYKRLKALGCVDENTVIVHGVGMTDEDICDAAPKTRGLVWCPTTNAYLLGKEPYDRTRKMWWGSQWYDAGGMLTLGSDSRLTAKGDLLHEMKQIGNLAAVTSVAAKILGLEAVAGHLGTNAYADWVAIKWTPDITEDNMNFNPEDVFWDAVDALRHDRHRADIALVVKGGVPQIGDPEVMAKFLHVETVAATLDGVPKAIHVDLARRILKCSLKEPGLEILEKPERRKVFGFI